VLPDYEGLLQAEKKQIVSLITALIQLRCNRIDTDCSSGGICMKKRIVIQIIAVVIALLMIVPQIISLLLY
jgi:hypothetical protein